MTNFANSGLNAVDQRPDNCAMMGLQATTTALAGSPPPPHHAQHQSATAKRRLEAATPPDRHAKAPRWDPPALKPAQGPAPADDCIARLRAVAESAWARQNGEAPSATPPAALTAPPPQTVLSDEEFEDDEFEDELEDEGCEGKYVVTAGGGVGQPYGSNRYHHHHQHHHHQHPQPPPEPHYWPPQYYAPPQAPPQQQQQPPQAPPPQQTIRRDANGKSYLELGPAPRPQPQPQQHAAAVAARRCCARWCRPAPCYRQRRLAVLNLSVCKLARYRQCSDPSLRRSVLICNTLRRLEREMESEPPDPPYPSPPDPAPPTRLPLPPPDFGPAYEQLRDLAGQSGRATPFPGAGPDDGDSGVGTLADDDEDDDAGGGGGRAGDDLDRPIDWGSVLSLSSRSGDDDDDDDGGVPLMRAWRERDEWEGLVAAVGGT